MKNEIVIYQSGDGLVKMEALVDTANETVWATQKAMAQLFGVSVPNISYHFKKIFSSGELDAQTVEKPCARDPRSPVPLTLAVQNSLTL